MPFAYEIRAAGTFAMQGRKYLIIKKIDFLAICAANPPPALRCVVFAATRGWLLISRRITIYFGGLALEWAAAFDVLIFAPLTPKGSVIEYRLRRQRCQIFALRP